MFEDTEAGIASATAAGLRVIAKRGTLDPHRLAGAEEIVDAIDVDLIRRLLTARSGSDCVRFRGLESG